MKETTKLKIGITLSLKTTDESIWTNGIKLNVLNLVRLLKRSKKEYEVCILNTVNLDWSVKPDYLKGIDIYFFDEKFQEMDFTESAIKKINGDDFDNLLEE